jgi:hypothetical protein
MVTIESNIDKVSGVFQKTPDILIDSVVKGVHEYMFTLQNQARRVHRYKRNTGTLERSIVSRKTKEGGTVFINEGACDYGKYVHMGQRSWNPDQFIFDAFDKTENILDSAIEKSVEKALTKAGL